MEQVRHFMRRVELNNVLGAHAAVCAVVGLVLVMLPHGAVGRLYGDYAHFTHELIRCYGALTLAQAWMTFRCRDIGDYRVRRFVCESYFVCYGIHFLALFRAQLTSPTSHGLTGWMCIFFSCLLSGFYGYFRFGVTIKAFELPSSISASDI